MAYSDMREFMDALKKAGELVEIDTEVDWYLEVGAIIRRTYEIGAPGVHFKKIRGYSKDYSIFGNPLGNGHAGPWSKFAIALELPPDTSYQKLRDEFHKRVNNPIKPVQVNTGPCKENIHRDREVNLFEFPAPYLHDGDGGRYLLTWGFVATKDLGSEWVNWGMYRVMIHTRNRAGGLVLPAQHIGMMYYQKYEARNQPMPFALAIGTEPASAITSCIPIPAGVNEADVAGGLRREPLQLVKCETNDLLVPATSEIVIEGVIMPRERWDEGPFGEWTGYRASPRMPRPVYRVNCITHRNSPILSASCMGFPIDETDVITGRMVEIMIAKDLREIGIVVKSIYCPPMGVGHLIIVSVKKTHPGIAHDVSSAVRADKMGMAYNYVIVCDEDINPTDLDQVLHALATKCHPKKGTQLVRSSPGQPLTPFLDLHERQYGMSATMTFDCTWPMEWDLTREIPPKVSFDTVYPSEVQEKVLEGWTTLYGLPDL